MNKPTMAIAHRIKGRIRIKISHPVRDERTFLEGLLKKDGITFARYNDVNKSILVEYDMFRITEEEVIIHIAALYSRSYDMIPIRVVYDVKSKNLPPMAIYSLMAIAIGGAGKYVRAMNPGVSDFINWAAVGTTVCAIVEHAYDELNERGYFDPEVVSIMYLVNSVKKGEFIGPSIVTWLTTFGRHILDMSSKRVLIYVKENRNAYTGEISYDVRMTPDSETSKSGNVIRTFIERFIELEGSRINPQRMQNFSPGQNIYSKPGMF